MLVKQLHPWDLTFQEATSVQKDLKCRLTFPPLKKRVKLVAGADISYSKKDPRLFAVVVVMQIPGMEIVEVQSEVGLSPFPYVSGFLAFRELPILCPVFEKIKNTPDVVICDGQGIAHPRGMGLAAHLGLLLNIPTIGCAKSRLIGEYDPVPEERWSQSSLLYKEKIVGAVVRTRAKVKPVFISPGNHIDLESSVKVVKQCVTRYRLPEPTRQAHRLVNQIRSRSVSSGEYLPTN